VNGAGKTTQLQIVMGRLTPDSGEVIKAKRNMKVAYLAQVRGVELKAHKPASKDTGWAARG
jgi:ABC-type Mn2+/Zn2+ transport system ATPase subunit